MVTVQKFCGMLPRRHSVTCALLCFVAGNCIGIPPAQAYDVNSPAWESQWGASDVDGQRLAGRKLMADLVEAAQQKRTIFTIAPGVYRANATINITNTSNFQIVAAGVQLIREGIPDNHFRFFNNTNISLQGPVTLDGNPFGFTQGVLIDTDNRTYITIRMMDGYEGINPSVAGRLMFFDSNGLMQPLYQITATRYENVSDGVVRAFLPDMFFSGYVQAAQNCIKIGNLVSIETASNGGIWLRGNNGVTLRQIYWHTKSLLFGQNEHGPIQIDELYGVRKPGTNRLNAGGYPLIALQGGLWNMSNSELGWNFDDLTDIQSGLWYAYRPVSPTSVYVSSLDAQLAVGLELSFYNLSTLQPLGSAVITQIQSINDSNLVNAFRDDLTSLGVINQNAELALVTLDRATQLPQNLTLVDIEQYRSQSISFENCSMHDSLASGITAKGARQVIIRNNTVVRAGNGGIGSGFDPYWWEGGVPGNIAIQDNIIVSSPYSVDASTASIATTVATLAALLSEANFTVIRNISIHKNTIISPPVSAISVNFVSDGVVTSNTIVNPVARIGQPASLSQASQPYEQASAIYLDVVSGRTEVSNNLIVGADARLVGQPIRVGSTTNQTGINFCSNAVYKDGNLTMLPQEFWYDIAQNSSMVGYSQNFPSAAVDLSGSRLTNQATQSINTSSTQSGLTFSFSGTGVQWYACTGPSQGMARVLLDGQNLTDIDTSVWQSGIVPDPAVGFCDQMLFQATNLESRFHTLSVITLGLPGKQSVNGASTVSTAGFAYLQGRNLCTRPISSPLPVVSVQESLSSWLNGSISQVSTGLNVGISVANPVYIVGNSNQQQFAASAPSSDVAIAG